MANGLHSNRFGPSVQLYKGIPEGGACAVCGRSRLTTYKYIIIYRYMNASRDHGCGAGELTIEHLERVARMLKLLAHPHRLKVVEALDVSGALPVFALMEKVGLAQAPMSQHLNLMRRAGLVEAERRGREIWYDVADRRCLGILNCIRSKRSAA